PGGHHRRLGAPGGRRSRPEWLALPARRREGLRRGGAPAGRGCRAAPALRPARPREGRALVRLRSAGRRAAGGGPAVACWQCCKLKVELIEESLYWNTMDMLRAKSTIWILAVVFVVSCLLLQSIRLSGDGLSYYAYARSLLFDGDLDFANEFQSYNPTHDAT